MLKGKKNRVTAICVLLLMFIGIRAQVLRVDRNEPIRQTIATADRHQAGRFFLEGADSLLSHRNTDYQILKGEVMFRKGDMLMYCDSAHFYDLRDEIEAYGNVRMEQGDTLFVYADELVYNDSTQLAVLTAYGNGRVRLINRDVELRTPVFYYDLGIDLGYYVDGGVLTDANNRLSSVYGEYAPNSAEALFRHNVDLTSIGRSDTLRILSEQLYYNTRTHIAEIDMPAEITSRNGVILTDSAIYNTETEYAQLFRRSTVITDTGRKITADSLIYDRRAGIANAYGEMVLTDTINKIMLDGDYGFLNELTDSALVTGRALAREYSQGDTLYLHSDTIRAFRRLLPKEESVPDTIRYVVAAHKVKFFRSDMQGVCDSLTFVSADSTLYMDRHPVVWSEERQIFGNVIEVLLNDSTIERAHLPSGGFMAEEIEEGFYQQLTGKEMTACFKGGEMERLYVKGNVEAITFPEENDSTINKVGVLETSELTMDFEKRNIKKLKAMPNTKLTLIPLYLAKRSDLYLKGFKWYADYRPTSPADVMVISPELAEFLNSEVEVSVRDRMRAATVTPSAAEEAAENAAAADGASAEDTETTDDNKP